MVVAALGGVAIYLNGPGLYCAAIALMPVFAGLYYVALRASGNTLRSIWRELRETADEIGVNETEADLVEADNYSFSMLIGALLSAVVYLLVFVPLALRVAVARGLALIDVLLFVDRSGGIASLGAWARIELLFTDPQFFLPLGALYGVVALAFLFVSTLRKKSLTENAAVIHGTIWGYTFALLASRWVGSEYQPALMTPALGIVYVVLLGYVAASLLENLPKWGMRLKYEHLIGGLGSLGAAFILSRIYGSSAALFGGVVFFLASFTGAAVWEVTIGRILLRFWPALGERPLAPRWEAIRSLVVRPCGRTRRAIPENTIIACAVYLLFPLLAFGAFRLILAAR